MGVNYAKPVRPCSMGHWNTESKELRAFNSLFADSVTLFASSDKAAGRLKIKAVSPYYATGGYKAPVSPLQGHIFYVV